MNKLLHELHLAVSKEITDGEWNLEQVMKIVEKELTRERAAANVKPVWRGAGRGHPPTASACSEFMNSLINLIHTPIFHSHVCVSILSHLT